MVVEAAMRSGAGRPTPGTSSISSERKDKTRERAVVRALPNAIGPWIAPSR